MTGLSSQSNLYFDMVVKCNNFLVKNLWPNLNELGHLLRYTNNIVKLYKYILDLGLYQTPVDFTETFVIARHGQFY